MRYTQFQFLEKFAQQLVDKGFIRTNYARTVVLRKGMTIANGTDCKITLSWLPDSWAVVKVQIGMDSIHAWYNVSVGLLMDYAGSVDDILVHLIKQTTAGIAESIIKQL